MAQKRMAGEDAQFSNVQIDFRPGEIYVSGDAKVGFFTMRIGILTTVAPVDGQAQVTIKEIFVNDKPAKGFLRQQIEALIAPQLNDLALQSKDFYAETIVVTDDAMITTGHYK